MQQHHKLYNKSSEEFSNSKVKKNLFLQKAAELGFQTDDDEVGNRYKLG